MRLVAILLLGLVDAADPAVPVPVPVAVAVAVAVDKEPVHHLVLDNERVRVFDVTVPPKGATLLHQHDRDYVFVTLGDSEVVNERQGSAPVTLKLKDADTRYVKGGFAHVAKNVADRPFHNITIELKDPGKPLCGAADTPACEAPLVFATEHGHARLITLEPGMPTRAHAHPTPHLTVAIDDAVLTDERNGESPSTVTLKQGQVAWVGATGFTHSIVNTGPRAARLLVLEVK